MDTTINAHDGFCVVPVPMVVLSFIESRHLESKKTIYVSNIMTNCRGKSADFPEEVVSSWAVVEQVEGKVLCLRAEFCALHLLPEQTLDKVEPTKGESTLENRDALWGHKIFFFRSCSRE